MADGSDNSRNTTRAPVKLKIKFRSATLSQFIERYSVDVSKGGIFIRTKDPLEVGTKLKFEFQLQDGSPLIVGDGTVVWIREHDASRKGVAPGMGVRFDELDANSQKVLTEILTRKAGGAASGVEEPGSPASTTDAKPATAAPAPASVTPAKPATAAPAPASVTPAKPATAAPAPASVTPAKPAAAAPAPSSVTPARPATAAPPTPPVTPAKPATIAPAAASEASAPTASSGRASEVAREPGARGAPETPLDTHDATTAPLEPETPAKAAKEEATKPGAAKPADASREDAAKSAKPSGPSTAAAPGPKADQPARSASPHVGAGPSRAKAEGSPVLKVLVILLVVVALAAGAYFLVTHLGGRGSSGRRGAPQGASGTAADAMDAEARPTATKDAGPRDAEARPAVPRDAAPREAPTPACDQGALVEVVSEPAGGKVFLDDKEQPGVTPVKVCVPKEARKGTVRVELDRYKPEIYYYRGLQAGQKLELKLTPISYRILVKTLPGGADVIIDGKPQAVLTTMSFNLEPTVERVVIKVRKAGYSDVEQVVERSKAEWQKQHRYSFLVPVVIRLVRTGAPLGDEPDMRPPPRRVEPMDEPMDEPRVEPMTEPMDEPRVEPMTEPMDEPMDEPMRPEPMTEPMRPEPMTEPMRPEPMTEPMRPEPRTEPMRPEPRPEPMQP